jgi:hypothetical protein
MLSDSECGEVYEAVNTVEKYLNRAASSSVRSFFDSDVEFVISSHIKLYEKEYNLKSIYGKLT